jgi:peptide/nickel transport system ATP-binding protein
VPTQPDTAVFSAKNVTFAFGNGKKMVRAVDDVTFSIADQEIVSLVGGSGCGKSVLAKIMLGLIRPASGCFLYNGTKIGRPRLHWREVQPVFQDPFSCFNQFFSIRSQLKASFGILAEKPSHKEMEERVDQALLAVNIKPPEIEGKYPFELSGGQMQRMLLARIFILRPKVLIADEPTSNDHRVHHARHRPRLLRERPAVHHAQGENRRTGPARRRHAQTGKRAYEAVAR